MAMSDCAKCWETPCSCGHEYKNYTKEKLADHIADITNYRDRSEAIEILKQAIKKVEKDGKR